MNGIRFDGLATGLQTTALIDALIGFERRPLNLLETRQNELEIRKELFRNYNSSLLALSNAAKAIDNQNSLLKGPTLDEEFLAFTATSSDEQFLTATATASAAPGTLDVRVDGLALAGRQVTFGFATDTEIVAQAGETLQIDFGGAAPIDITVGAGGASLQDLANLVNDDANNGGEVKAEVLFDGTEHRLVLSGTQTGAANDLVITTNVSGPGGSGPLFDSALGETAQDARLEVLGIAVTRPTNQINDLFAGVTLELHAVHDPADLTERTSIEIARDDSGIQEKLQTLVDTYNTVRQFSIDQTRYNAQSESAGLLSGDATLRSIDRRIQTLLGGSVSFAGNPFSTLSQIGLQFADDGLLTLDAEVLESALEQDAASVRQLLAGDDTTDGIATAVAKSLKEATLKDTGTVAYRLDSFDRQIRDLDQSIERFELRLEQREELLVERFSRLESLISSLQAQGGFIGSAFANNINNSGS